MIEITGVWIIDKNGELLFSYELLYPGSKNLDNALFSGLIVTLQRFIAELGEKDAERIEMGDSKIFISKDKDTDIIFIIRSMLSANNRKVTKVLNKIQKKFIQSFKPYFSKYSPADLKLYIHNIFKTYLESILNVSLSERMDAFLGNP
ncbi:MAG: hypothetical protein ACTSYB_12935 [Candidatus Helarchaeota archaeon]